MDSINLEMDDIFGEGHDVDDDFPTVGPLPDLPDEEGMEGIQSQENAEENEEVLAKLKDLSKGAAKKVVRKPQPKLDATRLVGERGIALLPKLFQDVKFKGKGNEVADLRLIMGKLEHWAHRLFPKMQFDEVLERVEKLGSKKEVQTCLKRIRLDMPVLNEDFVEEKLDEDEEEETLSKSLGIDPDDEDILEDLMHVNENPSTTTMTDQEDSSTISAINLPASMNTATPTKEKIATPQHIQSQSTPMVGMTPEQKERIERNKRLALEKRQAKLGTQGKASQASSVVVSSSVDPPLSQALDIPNDSVTSAPEHSSSNPSVEMEGVHDCQGNSEDMSEVIPPQVKDTAIHVPTFEEIKEEDHSSVKCSGDADSQVSRSFKDTELQSFGVSMETNDKEMSEIIPVL